CRSEGRWPRGSSGSCARHPPSSTVRHSVTAGRIPLRPAALSSCDDADVPEREIASGDPPLVFEPLAALDGQDIQRAQAIYEDGFPLHQRMAFDEIVDSARDGSRHAVVAEADGRGVGAAVAE